MALPTTGPISLYDVNIELGVGGTTTISLNQTTVRNLFEKTGAGSAISMFDGRGKSSAPPVYAPIITTDYGTGPQQVCEWGTWNKGVYVSGTLPISYELIMYNGSCSSPYIIDSGSTGGTGYTESEYIVASNSAASDGGIYAGGTPYKAANYKLRVYNSAGEAYSGGSSVAYGYCESQTTCPCGEECVEACCQVDCSGDCNSAYGCRGECDPQDFIDCDNNPCQNYGQPNQSGCCCGPTACGYDCSCWCGYETTSVYLYNTYAPSGGC